MRLHVKYQRRVPQAIIQLSRLTQNFDEQMDRFEPDELVVIRVDTEAEEESSVAAVDELMIAELSHVGRHIRRASDLRGRGMGARDTREMRMIGLHTWGTCGARSRTVGLQSKCHDQLGTGGARSGCHTAAHLDKIGLVFLIPGCYQAVHLTTYTHFLVVVEWHIFERAQARRTPRSAWLRTSADTNSTRTPLGQSRLALAILRRVTVVSSGPDTFAECVSGTAHLDQDEANHPCLLQGQPAGAVVQYKTSAMTSKPKRARARPLLLPLLRDLC